MISKPFCNTHLIYYEEAELKTILFEAFLCNQTALKALLFQDRFKKMLEKLSLAAILVYIFVDIAFKFKLLGQSRRAEFDLYRKSRPFSPEPNDLRLFKEMSIFEMYFYSDTMRLVIHRLLGESLLQVSLAVNLMYLFYKTVDCCDY